LAALEVATGVTPVVAGKPERQLYEEALRRLNASSETTAMVGDRLDTDMAGAERAGLSTVLVLSGIAGEGDLESSAVQPDVVCADIGELIGLWKQALLGS
jgi:ribonucleotide monophosphatase NagD (HAD superfamily)